MTNYGHWTIIAVACLLSMIFNFHFTSGSSLIASSYCSAQKNSFLQTWNFQKTTSSKCKFVSTIALGWEDAHSFCRREGGFLPSAEDLNDLTELQYEEIWTALRLIENHYQWLSRTTEFAGSTVQWEDDMEPKILASSQCPVYKTRKKKFNQDSSCEDEKMFVCILNRNLEVGSIGNQGDLELRATANISPNESDWIEVSLQTFDELEIKCSVNSMNHLGFQDSVNWKKDGISIPFHNSIIQPSKIAHFSKPIFLNSSNASRTLDVTRQGTFCCEMWLPFSTKVKRSNCLLVTLKNVTTLIFFAVVERPAPVNELLKEVKSSLGENPVILPEIIKTVDFKTKYQLHVENVEIETIKEVISEISKALSESSFFKNGSDVALATFCLEKNITSKFGNEISLPFTKAGSSYQTPYKCVNRANKPVHNFCQWNFTDGARVISTGENFLCNKCPKGFQIIGDRLCAKIIRNVTWNEGFSQLYQTGNERVLFDGASYLDPTKGIKNASYHRLLLDYLIDSEVSKVWFLIKRNYPITPYIDQSIRKSYNDTYLANAKGNFVKIDWIKGHPQADKQCATLDVGSVFLSSEECEKKSNFIAFVDLNELVTNSSFLYQDPRLCPEGWYRVIYSKSIQVCVRYYHDKFFKSRTEAEAFCALQGSQLVNPCRGFMAWIIRGFLKENEKVWLNPIKKTCDWLADSYISNKYIMSHEGWENDDEKHGNSYSVICEKKIAKYSIVRLSLRKNRELTKQANYTNPICLRAKPFPHVGNLSLTCLKNGAVIQPYITKSDKCLCIIDMDEQGFYECSIWSNFPLEQVWSPTIFNKDEKFVSYVVIGSESRLIYNPFYYDSTFYQNKLRKKFEPACMNIIFKILNNATELNSNDFTNVYFSQNKGTFQYSFHLQCKEPYISMCSSKEKVEMELKRAVSSDPTAAKICTIKEVKNVLGCPVEKVYSKEHLLTWSATDGAGIFLPKEHCILRDGQPISRKCNGSFMTGFYWDPPPISGCPIQPTNRTIKLWKIRDDSKNDVYVNFSEIAHLTNKIEYITAADFVNVAYTMRYWAKKVEKVHSKMGLEEVAATMNNVMGSNEAVLELVSENFNATSLVLGAFEILSFLAAGNTEALSAKKSRLTTSVFNISTKNPVTGFQWRDSDFEPLMNEAAIDVDQIMAAIKFPENLTLTALNTKFKDYVNYDSQLLFALYEDTHLFLDNETLSSGYRINSQVIQSTFRGVSVNNYLLGDKMITLNFRPTHLGNDMKCAFWDYQKNAKKGGWSEKGCSLIGLNEGLVTCHCDHLTSFTVLIKGLSIHKSHERALDVLSIIGCTFSIIGLVFVLLTFVCFKKFRESLANKILANLSVAILLSLTIFLAEIEKTQNKTVCEVVAIVLTYFILVSFGWMLVEAISNYHKFVKVYGVYIPKFMWKASVFAWGMPVIPIVVLLTVNGSLRDSELENNICWLSTDSFMYIFVPYVIIILVINTIIYILIIHAAIFGRVRVQSTVNQKQMIVSQICMATCVFFLLGLSWIFGFLSYIKEAIVFAYFFCIFCTLQGFVIFFFHIYRNGTVREFWFNNKKLISMMKPKPDETNNVGMETDTAMSTSL